MRLGSGMPAGATTGAASGPLPASSQPATGNTPRFIAARSREKVGRILSGSPSGRRGARLMAAILRGSAGGIKSQGGFPTGGGGSGGKKKEKPPRNERGGFAGPPP